MIEIPTTKNGSQGRGSHKPKFDIGKLKGKGGKLPGIQEEAEHLEDVAEYPKILDTYFMLG